MLASSFVQFPQVALCLQSKGTKDAHPSLQCRSGSDVRSAACLHPAGALTPGRSGSAPLAEKAVLGGGPRVLLRLRAGCVCAWDTAHPSQQRHVTRWQWVSGGSEREEVSFPSADTDLLQPWVCRMFQAVAPLWKVTARFFLAAGFPQEQAHH